MARTRTLADLRDDAYKCADLESAEDRHPPSDVTRYINQGGAELRDLIIEARGRTFFRSATPQTITTSASSTRYDLAEDFYRLISVRLSGDGGYTLDPFNPQDEPALREPGMGNSRPTHYELQANAIELLPAHAANLTVVVEYIPAFTDLVTDFDVLEGYSGWEEYPVLFAARCMAIKDADWERVRALTADLDRLKARIQRLAPHRDAFRSETIKDVRQTRYLGRARRGF